MATAADAPEVTCVAETGQAISELRKIEDGLDLAPEIVLSLAKPEESGMSQYVNEPVNPVIEDKIGTSEGEKFLESPSLTKFVVEQTCQASEDSGSQEKLNLQEKETLKSTSTLHDDQTNESIEGENTDASDKEVPVHIEGESIKTEDEKLVKSSELLTEEAIESTETTDDCTIGDKVGTFSEQVAVDLNGENEDVANTIEFSTQEIESAQVTNILTDGLKVDDSVKEVPVSMIEEYATAEDACQVKSSELLAEEKPDEPVEATNSLTEGDGTDTSGKEVLAALPREHINPEVEKQAKDSDLLTEEKTHEYVEVTDHLQLQEGDRVDNSVKEVAKNVTGENVKREDEHLVKSFDLSPEERTDESVEETDDLKETNKVETSIPVDVQLENVDLEDEQLVQSSEILAKKKADGTRSGEGETSSKEVIGGANVKAEDEQKEKSTQLITEEKIDEHVEATHRPAEADIADTFGKREPMDVRSGNVNPEDEKQAKPSESFTEEKNVEEQVQTELLPSSIPSDSNIPNGEESGSFDINDEVIEKSSQNAGEFSEIKQEAAEENQETSNVIHSDLLKSADATHDEPTLEAIHASQSVKEEKAINDLQKYDTEGSKSCMDLSLQVSDESPQTVEEPLGPDQEASSPAPDHAEPSQERDVAIERESEHMEEIIEKTREQETCNDQTSTGKNLYIKDEHIKSDSSEVCFQEELEGTSHEKPFDVAHVEKGPETMSQDEGIENEKKEWTENPRESHVNLLATASPDILNGESGHTENEKKIPVTVGMEETAYHKAETEEGEMPECTMTRSLAQRSQEITEREMNEESSLEDKLQDENIERVEARDEEDQERSQPREESVVVKLEGAVEAVTEVPEIGLLSTNDEAEGIEKEDMPSTNQEKSFDEESEEFQTKSSDNIEHEIQKEEVFEADNETTKQIIEDVAAVAISTDSVGEETVNGISKNNEVVSNEVCEGLEENREREEAEKLMKDGGNTNLSTVFSKEETTGHSFHDDEMAKNQEEAKEHKETLEIVGGKIVAEEEITQTETNETISDASISIPDVSTEQVEERNLEQDESTTRQTSSCISEQEDAGKADDETKHDIQVPASVTTSESVGPEYEVECTKSPAENKAEGEPREISIPPSEEQEFKLIEENDPKKCESVMENDTQAEEIKIPEQIMEGMPMRKEESANLKEANKLLCEDIDGENPNEECQQTQENFQNTETVNVVNKEVLEQSTLKNTSGEENLIQVHMSEGLAAAASCKDAEDDAFLKEKVFPENLEKEESNGDKGRYTDETSKTETHTVEVVVSPDVALNNPYKEVDALPISHSLDEQTAEGIDEKHGEVFGLEPEKEIQGQDRPHPDVEELQLETKEIRKNTASANSDDRRTAEVKISDLIQTSETECTELTNTSKGDPKSEDSRAQDNEEDEERNEEQTTITDFHQKGIEDEKAEERIVEEDSSLKDHDTVSLRYETVESSFEGEKDQKIVKEPEPELEEMDHSCKMIDAEDRKIDAIQKDKAHDEFQATNASDDVEVIEPEVCNVQDISTESVGGQTINEYTGEDKKEEENPDGEVPEGHGKSGTTTDRGQEIEDNSAFKDAQYTGEEADTQMYLEQTRTDNYKEEEEKEEGEVKESKLLSAEGFAATTISIEQKDTVTEAGKDSNDNPSDFNATTEAAAETIQRENSLKATEASIVVSAEHTNEETSEKAHDANRGSPRASVPSVGETLSMKENEPEDGKKVETSPHASDETHSAVEEESGTGSTTVVETEMLEETSDFNKYPTNETTIGKKLEASDIKEDKILAGAYATHEKAGATSESEMTDLNEHFNENSENIMESSIIGFNEQEHEEEKIPSGAYATHEKTGATSDSETTNPNECFNANSENVEESSMPISKEREHESIAMDTEIKEETPLAREIQNENLETPSVAQPKEETEKQVEEPLTVEKPKISTELVAEDQGQAKLFIAKEVGEIAADWGISSIDNQITSQTFQNKGTKSENLDEAQRELAFEDRIRNDMNQPIENETLVSEAIEKLSDIEMVDKHIIDEEKIHLKEMKDVTSNEVHEADNAPARNFETSESIEQNETNTPGETHLEKAKDVSPVAEVSGQEMVKERDFAEITEASNFSEGKEILREGMDDAHKLDTDSHTVVAEKIKSPEIETEDRSMLEASATDFEEKRVETLETNETSIKGETDTNHEISSVSQLPEYYEKAGQKITDEKPDNKDIKSIVEMRKDTQEKDEMENKEIHEEVRRADEINKDNENSKEEIVEAVNPEENIDTKDGENQEKVANEASVSDPLVEEVSEIETESKSEEALNIHSEELAKALEYESQPQLHVTDINTEENGNKEDESIVLEHETAIPCSSGNSFQEDKKTDKQPEEAEQRVDAEEHQIGKIRKDNEGIQEETSTEEVSNEFKTDTAIENTAQEVLKAEDIITSEERVNEYYDEDKGKGEKAQGETAKTEPEDQINEKEIDETQIEKTHEAPASVSYEVQTELDNTHANEGIEQITGEEGPTRDTTLVKIGEEIIQEKYQELEKNEEIVEMVSGELKPEEPKTKLESEKDQDMKTDEVDLTQAEFILNREIKEVSEELEKADAHKKIDRSIAEKTDLYQVHSHEEKAEEIHQKEDLDIDRVEEESSKLSSEKQDQEENDIDVNTRNEKINGAGSRVETLDLERAGSSYETEGVTATGDESHAPSNEDAMEEAPKLSKEFKELSEIEHEESITEIITTNATRTETANEDGDPQNGQAEHEKVNIIFDLESRSTEESKELQIKEVPTNNSGASIPEIPEVEGKITEDKEKLDFAFAREATAEMSQKTEEREDNSKNEAPVEETMKTEENTQDVKCENKEQGNSISTQEETPHSIEKQEKPSDGVTDNAQASRREDSTETTETKISTGSMAVPLIQEEKGKEEEAKTEPDEQVQNMATVGEETIHKEHQEVEINVVAQMVSVESSTASKTIAEVSQTMEEKEDNTASKTIAEVSQTMEEKEDNGKNEAPPEKTSMTQLITCENEEERNQVSQQEKTPTSIEMLENPSNDATDDGLTPRAADSITKTGTKTSTGSRNISSNQEDQCEKASASAEVIYPKHGEASEIEPNVKTVECEEKPAQDVKEDTMTSFKLSEADNVPLSDLLQNTIKEIHQTAGTDTTEPPAKNEETENNETPSRAVEEQATGEEEKDEDVEENEEEEHRITDSGSDAPVMVDASRDIDVKPSPKKSHNLLSGMGSKVKHSIAKVKKAITGKSSHHKQSSPK